MSPLPIPFAAKLGPPFDKQGSGATYPTAINPCVWPHTIGGNAVIAALHVISTGGGPTGLTAEIGGATAGSGTAMTEIFHQSYAGPIFNYFATVYVWKLLNGPTGAQSIRVLGSNWAGLAGYTANSLSYKDVSAIGALVFANGGGNVSLSVTAGTRQRVVTVMVNTDLGHGADSGFSAYNGVTRVSQYMSPLQQPLLIGDLPGNPTVVATANGASDCPWAAAGVALS